MAFAEVSDIEARWRDLSADEEQRAAVLIDDASAMLSSLMSADVMEERTALLKMVTCNMVIRSMSQSDSDLFGVTQTSMTAGPYSQSFSYSNPSGDMYLTKQERNMLGIGAGYIGSIRPAMEGEHEGD